MNNNQPFSKYFIATCFKILNYIDKHPNTKQIDIINKMNIQPAMTSCAIAYLRSLQLISFSVDTPEITINHPHGSKIWYKAMNESYFSPDCYFETLDNEQYKIHSYLIPDLKNINYRELNPKEYLYAKEFFDYESTTLLKSVNWTGYPFTNQFFMRQFNSLLEDKSGKKRTHVFIAEQNNSILGLISISNYCYFDYLNHNLPCEKHNIFNVNLVATRKEASNLGIATKLVKLASDKVFNDDNAFALCYDPLIPESKSVMMKVFNNPKFMIHERTYDNIDEIETYGTLRQFIITKSPLNINYEENQK